MSEQTHYDFLVIGGGPGGYVAAIKAAQLGLKTACIEKRGALGGTCLNVGCIPSKALLQSSHLFEEINHHAAEHGIIASAKLDLAAMMKRKDEAVKGLTQGIEGLFKKNKIDYIKGHGTLTAPGKVRVDGKEITAKTIVIATGSDVASLPGVTIDEQRILSSTGALSLPEVPKHLVVIGGGVIGLELGSVWKRLGAEVIVIEYMDGILPGTDLEVAKSFHKILTKQGVAFKLGAKVESAKNTGKGAEVTFTAKGASTPETIQADYVLMAVGRRPYTENLGLEALGIEKTKRGFIVVDAHLQTKIPGIYAIGDVIEGPMLAHKAEEEGVFVAEQAAGQKPHINYDAIPGVVYTWPEIASVGATEEQLKEKGVAYNTGKFPFLANSRGRAVGETDGFVKILADKTTDRVLGVHILGPDAGTLIAEAVLAMEYGASSEDIARTCHAHPTLNEAVKEAALAAFSRPIHM